MEFKNQYLTYEEYVELGGTLEETPFNILEVEARKTIDKYTFGRLKNLNKQIEEVKICEYNLIGALNSYSDYSKQNKGVSSENIDGYSVSYSGVAENVSEAKINETKGIIKTYLSDCKLDDGTPYLYVGGVRYDNKPKYYLL